MNEPITPEEREQLRKDRADRFMNIGIARKAIIDTGLSSGALQCPVCNNGLLRFSVARSNGHVHASCTTRLCVSWIE